MDVRVVDFDGLEPDDILCLSAGLSRRMAAISSEKHLSFPGDAVDFDSILGNPMKVQVLRQIGKAYLVLKPRDQQYRVVFEDALVSPAAATATRSDSSAPANAAASNAAATVTATVSATATTTGAGSPMSPGMSPSSAGVLGTTFGTMEAESVEPPKPSCQLYVQPRSGEASNGHNISASSTSPFPMGDQAAAAAAAEGAQEYLNTHRLLPFMQAALHAVIKERPDDPYEYMVRHFLSGYCPAERIVEVPVPMPVPAGEETALTAEQMVVGTESSAAASPTAGAAGPATFQEASILPPEAADSSPNAASTPPS